MMRGHRAFLFLFLAPNKNCFLEVHYDAALCWRIYRACIQLLYKRQINGTSPPHTHIYIYIERERREEHVRVSTNDLYNSGNLL
jgi:hypothetical protein